MNLQTIKGDHIDVDANGGIILVTSIGRYKITELEGAIKGESIGLIITKLDDWQPDNFAFRIEPKTVNQIVLR